MGSISTLTLTILFCVTLAAGEVVRTQKCHVPAGKKSTCTVHEVRIDPCPEAAENKPCKFKLGTNASFSFDYTPEFSAEKPKSQAFKVGTLVDIGFEQMDTDGCKYTKCPIEANKKQSYLFDLEVGKHFIVGVHQTKMKLWNDADHHQQCCFKLSIQLTP